MAISAMFPIIPHHLNVRAACPTPRPPEARKKIKVAVVAAEDIPALTCSPSIPLDSVIHDRLDKHEFKLGLTKTGLLAAKDSASEAWVRHVRFAPDCHSFNILVHRTQGQSAVHLQTVREIREGEEICLWYDEDFLALAGIPFLTPNNIQGEKQYICHICRKHFEYPNPLKIHLSLDCGTLRRIDLWKRLATANVGLTTSVIGDDTIRQKDYERNLNRINFRDIPKLLNRGPSSPDSCSLSTASTPPALTISKTNEELVRPSSEPALGRYSAFKPYLNFHAKAGYSEYNPPDSLVTIPRNLIFSSVPLTSTQHVSRVVPSTFAAINLHKKMESSTSLVDQQAVEMETLVSNLGRSKQGHLCIYCGKIYSRKYGLKIHIRTHTGFKPLKCKFCMRPFGDPSNLNKHVRLHSEGETPYKCEECGKVLVRRRDLERHMKSRHQQEDCM